MGDARCILEKLAGLCTAAGIRRSNRSEEVAALKNEIHQECRSRAPDAVQLRTTMRKALSPETVVVNDLTVAAYWSHLALEIYEPRTCLYPAGFATLEFALPVAIGAKLAQPHRPVVALSGDDGFFNCHELATVAKYELSIINVVFNDNAFCVLKP